jgi:hypothetical protein
MVAHADDLSTHEAKAGGLQVWNQPGLHSEFQSTTDYIARLCLKKKSSVVAYACNPSYLYCYSNQHSIVLIWRGRARVTKAE